MGVRRQMDGVWVRDQHHNPTDAKEALVGTTRTFPVNSEAGELMQPSNPGPQLLPPFMGEG